MADRFYTPDQLTPGDYTLTGPDAHHMTAVRRFAVGDRVTLFDGSGQEFTAEIQGVGKKIVTLAVLDARTVDREIGFDLHLVVAMPKGDRGDYLVEKLTELGVTRLTPLISERTVVQPKDNRLESLQRAVIEASKQCGRNHLLTIHPPQRLTQILTSDNDHDRFILHTVDTPGGVPNPSRLTGVTVLVGPEGGFTSGEVSAATAAGWRAVSLGPRVLRTETAAVAVTVRLTPER